MKIIYLTLCLSVFLTNCSEKVVPEPAKPESPTIWKNPFELDELSSTPVFFNNWVIVGHPGTTDKYKVYAFDAMNGDTIWQQKFNPPGAFNPFDKNETFLYKDKLVFASGHNFFVLSAFTGDIIWWKRVENSLPHTTIIDHFIYRSTRINWEYSTLYRYDIHTGEEEELLTIHRNDDRKKYSPDLCSPVKWMHPSGDEILILQNRTFGKYVDYEPKMDILAYNLSADSLFWYIDSLDWSSSVSQPAINGNKVYFYGYDNAWCIDAATGKKLWHFNTGDDPEGDFNTANILIVKDKLIVKPDSDRMHAVDKETGKLIWSNYNTASMPGMLTERNDTIWFSSGGIFAIDANTGNKLLDWNNDRKGSWIFPVAFHPVNGNIYTSDSKYFYCLNPKYMK